MTKFIINPSTRTNTKYRLTDRKRSLYLGGVICLILITSPFMFYLYRIAPSDSNEWYLGIITLRSGGFSSVQSFIHALFTKLLFLITFAIWYLTNHHWWKHAILVPLTMVLFQITGVINYSISFIDEYDFWYSLPITIPTILFLYWLSRYLNHYSTAFDLKDEIDNELNALK